MKVKSGKGKNVLKIGRVRTRFVLHPLQFGFGPVSFSRLLFKILQLFDKISGLAIVRVEIEAGLCHKQGIIKAVKLEQEINVTVGGFRTVGTECKRLFEGKISFFNQLLLLALIFGQILRWRGGSAQHAETPGINTGDGAAEFGERLLRVVIADEFAAAFEAGEIAVPINFFREVGNFLDAGIISNPVANQPLGVLAPKLMVFLKTSSGNEDSGCRLIFIITPNGVS